MSAKRGEYSELVFQRLRISLMETLLLATCERTKSAKILAFLNKARAEYLERHPEHRGASVALDKRGVYYWHGLWSLIRPLAATPLLVEHGKHGLDWAFEHVVGYIIATQPDLRKEQFWVRDTNNQVGLYFKDENGVDHRVLFRKVEGQSMTWVMDTKEIGEEKTIRFDWRDPPADQDLKLPEHQEPEALRNWLDTVLA